MFEICPEPKEMARLRRKGYTNMEIVTGIASAYETPGRLKEITDKEWENAESTVMGTEVIKQHGFKVK